jgi:F420-dependent oxidoreductase-like protein
MLTLVKVRFGQVNCGSGYRAGMRIGIFAGTTGTVSPADVETDASSAAAAGFDTYWLPPQVFGWDVQTIISVVGQRVPGIRFGTAVVSTHTRHPWALAQQALTIAALTEGRFSLGIGVSDRQTVEDTWGLPYDRPVRHLREYLDVLEPLLRGERVDATGSTVSAHGELDLPVTPCPLLVAALGPRLLELAGARADGTITWMTGPATLSDHTVPVVGAAAREAGRPPPEIVVGVPVCVTGDPVTARAYAGRVYAAYGQQPSCRAMLDREGLDGPEDLAVIGDEAAVSVQLRRFFAAGATQLAVAEFGPTIDDRRRTRGLLAALVRDDD